MDMVCFLRSKRRRSLKEITSTEKNNQPLFQISLQYSLVNFPPYLNLLISNSPKLSPMSSISNPWILTCILLSLPMHFTISAAVHSIPINGTCHDTCGTIPVKYPFGSGFGCGHPDFARYVRCNSGTLEFSTGTGIYNISEIDYSTGTLIITDPFMSTCSSMQNSGSFSLDRASPFSLTGENIFVLLGCSTNSPLFDPAEDLCATGSRSRVCRGLYFCKGVTGIGLPQNAPPSTCCVYESPIQLAGYTLDLPKLQCSSYTSVYSFGGSEGDPLKWKFGISLQYNGSYYSNVCKDCETSGGLCGFAGFDQSFACICRNGKNTSTSCFGQGYAWSGTRESKIQTKLSFGGLLLLWLVLSI